MKDTSIKMLIDSTNDYEYVDDDDDDYREEVIEESQQAMVHDVFYVEKNLKIFSVDISDGAMKKYDLISDRGILEVLNYNENKEKVYVVITVPALSSINSKRSSISSSGGSISSSYDKVYQADIQDIRDNDLVKRNQESRLEFFHLKNSNNRLQKRSIVVDFRKSLDCTGFYTTLKNLIDIYYCEEGKKEEVEDDADAFEQNYESYVQLEAKDEQQEQDNSEYVTQKESVLELSESLAEAIRSGDAAKSKNLVDKLARLRANLNITVVANNNDEHEQPQRLAIKENLTKILVYQNDDVDDDCKLLENETIKVDIRRTSVAQLKKMIANTLKFDANSFGLIIGDFLANEEKLIVDYLRKRKTNDAGNENEELEVYIHKLDDPILVDIDDSNPLRRQKMLDAKELEENFTNLAAHFNKDLNENVEPFNCDICLEKSVAAGQGIILKECLHVFCKECLQGYINSSEEPSVKCPYSKDYQCDFNLLQREIKALLTPDDYEKFQMKSLKRSEATMANTFHCLEPDCIGFCVHEDGRNFFECPVCEKVNCLRCNVIHMAKTCKEYQDDLKIAAQNDKNAKKNMDALKELVEKRKAMYCPGCKIILCKAEGCDWLQCQMCKMEICWATRGPRWGPKGNGDTSGGCKCNFVGGKPCHPRCQNCH